jgi:four helix bundle protein
MNNYKELNVWQKAIELVKEVYKLTDNFPNNEQFGLTSQIRRAAVSIPSNIAEGAGRRSNKEFEHFLSISLGSCFEVETQIIIGQELNFANPDNCDASVKLITEVQKMIRGLQKSLQTQKSYD